MGCSKVDKPLSKGMGGRGGGGEKGRGSEFPCHDHPYAKGKYRSRGRYM